MQKRTLYLLLVGVDAVVTMIAFAPWVAADGLNPQLFSRELFNYGISTFFALDLLLTACAVVILRERRVCLRIECGL